MRTWLPLLLGLLLGLTACHRDKTPAPKPYSTWIVNNHDTFRTNNVETTEACNPDHSYCASELMSMDNQNWFHIGFLLAKLPLAGKWPLGNFFENQSNQEEYAFIYFYHDGKGGYVPAHPELDTLYISSNSGKASYTLHEMWFVNNNDLTDSILIQGVFSVP